MPFGKSTPDVPPLAACSGDGADQPKVAAYLSCDLAGSLETGKNRRRVQHQLDRSGHILDACISRFSQLVQSAFVYIEADSARPDQSASKSVAAKQRGHIQKIPSNSCRNRTLTEGSPHRRPERPDLRYGWPAVRVPRRCRAEMQLGQEPATGERFHCMAIGHGMADRCIAGSSLDQVNPALGGPCNHRALDSAMLVSERNFQMIDIFTVALESEMARLDDARMNRSDGHLMNFRSAHLEIFRNADWIGCRAEDLAGLRPIAMMKTNRLEPGMSGGTLLPTARQSRVRTSAPGDNRASTTGRSLPPPWK